LGKDLAHRATDRWLAGSDWPRPAYPRSHRPPPRSNLISSPPTLFISAVVLSELAHRAGAHRPSGGKHQLACLSGKPSSTAVVVATPDVAGKTALLRRTSCDQQAATGKQSMALHLRRACSILRDQQAATGKQSTALYLRRAATGKQSLALHLRRACSILAILRPRLANSGHKPVIIAAARSGSSPPGGTSSYLRRLPSPVPTAFPTRDLRAISPSSLAT